jgi:hypothetical protein
VLATRSRARVEVLTKRGTVIMSIVSRLSATSLSSYQPSKASCPRHSARECKRPHNLTDPSRGGLSTAHSIQPVATRPSKISSTRFFESTEGPSHQQPPPGVFLTITSSGFMTLRANSCCTPPPRPPSDRTASTVLRLSAPTSLRLVVALEWCSTSLAVSYVRMFHARAQTHLALFLLHPQMVASAPESRFPTRHYASSALPALLNQLR